MNTSAYDAAEASLHPSPASLASFGLGRLDDESAIASHVASCEACRSVVEAVADDTLAALLRDAAGRRSLAGAVGLGGVAASPSGYELLEVLGEGGMGIVFKARQVGLGRLVALKQIRPEALAGAGGVARFRREAEASARLRHPNIVQIFDVGRLAGVPYYAMEYVEGGTLADRLDAGPLAPAASARLVETLSRAVQHAHEAGIVHRDLKPANVLLAPDLESPKIGDFGLAKREGDDGSRTATGAILGTPNYMAPEQAAGDSARVGAPADVYALGAILYELLAGRPPFRGASTMETLDLVRHAEPTPPRAIRPVVPRDLETIALKCLEKGPGRRYASALALADDLRRHLDGEPIRARRISAAERAAKWAHRRPWEAASAALGVLVLAGLVGGTLLHNARLRDEVGRTAQRAAEAREQRGRADIQYRSARDAIRRMLGRLDATETTGKPIPIEVRRRLLEDALAFYDGVVRDDGPSDFAASFDRTAALQEAATLQIMAGRHGDAERTLRRAVASLDALEAERPGDAALAEAQISCRIKLAAGLGQAGRTDEAVGWLDGASERAERLPRLDPSSFVLGDTAAWAQHNLGVVLLQARRFADAEPYLRRAEGLRVGLLRDHPEQVGLRQRLAETLTNLALVHAQTGRPALAEEGYARAVDWLTPVVRDHPEAAEAPLSLGELALNWGTLAAVSSRNDRAVERFKLGTAAIETTLRATPDWPRARTVAMQLYASLAQSLGNSGRRAESARALERAAELADGADRRRLRLVSACNFAHIGEVDRALAQGEAAMTSGGEPPGAEDFYNMACVAAAAAGASGRSGDGARADRCAAEAVGWLERTRSAGFFRDARSLALLDTDPDLAARPPCVPAPPPRRSLPRRPVQEVPVGPAGPRYLLLLHHHLEVVADLRDLPGVLLMELAEHLDAPGGAFLLGVLDVFLVGIEPLGLRLEDGEPVVHQVADRVGLGHGRHEMGLLDRSTKSVVPRC